MNLHNAIAAADSAIRSAILTGNMELARVLISRKFGWRICAGEIAVKLRRRNYVDYRDA